MVMRKKKGGGEQMDEVAKAVLVGILTVVIAVINQEDRDR